MDTWRTSVSIRLHYRGVCMLGSYPRTCNVNPLEELKPFIYFSQEYLFVSAFMEFQRWEKHPAKSNITVSNVFNKCCFCFLRNMINQSRSNKQNVAARDDKVPQAPPFLPLRCCFSPNWDYLGSLCSAKAVGRQDRAPRVRV